MRLYHYTCSHRAPLIRRAGRLDPYPQPMLHGRPLVWLTDMAEPDRQGLGLTSTILTCDRLAYRCTVDTDDAEPWVGWHWGRVDPSAVSALTLGRMTRRWWVSEVPVAVTRVERQP